MRASTVIQPERIRRLKEQVRASAGEYVLYWMQSAQRAEDNPALELACQKANEHSLPLVVAFVLTPEYPEANLRHYVFMLEGLVETFESLRKRNILPLLRFGDPPTEILNLAESCLLYTSPSPRDQRGSRMPSSA